MMYYDYEDIFFDILNYIEENTKKNKEKNFVKDDPIETLILILGYKENIDNNSLVGYIKSKSAINLKFKERLYNILTYLKNKISKYDKTILKIKLKRANRLTTGKLVDYTKLIGNNFEETKENINKKIYELKNSGDIDNIINNEIAANNAMISSLNLINIPNVSFSTYLEQLIYIIGNDSKYNLHKLNMYRDFILKEKERLSKIDKIISGGYIINGVDISLIKIIDILIFILEKKYNCQECRYYKKGNNGISICSYQKSELNPKTKPAVIIDENKNNISGYITNENLSCKDVWDLINNDYFSPNDKNIKEINEKFKGG